MGDNQTFSIGDQDVQIEQTDGGFEVTPIPDQGDYEWMDSDVYDHISEYGIVDYVKIFSHYFVLDADGDVWMLEADGIKSVGWNTHELSSLTEAFREPREDESAVRDELDDSTAERIIDNYGYTGHVFRFGHTFVFDDDGDVWITDDGVVEDEQIDGTDPTYIEYKDDILELLDQLR